MAVNETQVTGRKYRVWDDINNIWKRFSFWTKASDVELNNGTTVEGAIRQINTNLTILDDKINDATEIITIQGATGDTYKTLLNKVWNAIDKSKIKPSTTLKLANNAPGSLTQDISTQCHATIIGVAGSGVAMYAMMIKNGNSEARQYSFTTSGLTITDISNTVVNSATIQVKY